MRLELTKKIEQAHKVISEQCIHGRWQMCVPVQKDDSDQVLLNTLDALVAEIEILETQIKNSGPTPTSLKTYYDLPVREVRKF